MTIYTHIYTYIYIYIYEWQGGPSVHAHPCAKQCGSPMLPYGADQNRPAQGGEWALPWKMEFLRNQSLEGVPGKSSRVTRDSGSGDRGSWPTRGSQPYRKLHC